MPAIGFDALSSLSGISEETSVNTTTVTTTPSTHPTRNPTLVPRALGESSMRIAAMIGIGTRSVSATSARSTFSRSLAMGPFQIWVR